MAAKSKNEQGRRRFTKLKKLLNGVKQDRGEVHQVQEEDKHTRDVCTEEKEIMDRFDMAVKKFRQVSKASGTSGSERIMTRSKASSSQTTSQKAASSSGAPDAVGSPASDSPGNEKPRRPTSKEKNSERLVSWVKSNQMKPVETQNGRHQASESAAPEQAMTARSRTTSRTASWVRSKLSCLCGGDVDAADGRPVEPHGYDITSVVRHRKEEVLKSVFLTKADMEKVRKQIEFLKRQLEGIQKASQLEEEFVQVVDDFDSLSLGHQRLQHKLEELQNEREILQRKVLSSASASKAVRVYGGKARIPHDVRVQDIEALTRLAYAGLLKER